MGYVKIFSTKNSFMGMVRKRKSTEQEDFITHVTDKVLFPRICKIFLEINKKNAGNSLGKAKIFKHLLKRITKWPINI